MTRLTRLKQLAQQATPGPWHEAGDNKDNVIQTSHITRDVWHIAFCPYAGETDARFIAASNPQTVLALIETIEEMERAINSLYDSLKHGDETHQEWLKNHIAKHFSKALTGHLKFLRDMRRRTDDIT